MVIIPFTYISIRYGLNYLSALPIKNNPTYTTWSIVVANFTPSYITLKYIYIRNPLSLDLSSKNCLIKGNLTFTTLILLIFPSSNLLLSIN